MGKHDRISAIFWLLFGVFILWGGQSYPMGSFREPGGGLYPTLLGSLLIILASILLIDSRRNPLDEAPSWNSKGAGLRRVILALGGLLISPLLFSHLGFFPTVFIFILFITKVVLPLRWLTALATSLMSTVGGYFLFVFWL